MADNPGIFGGLHCVDVLDLIWVSDSWVASPKEGGGGEEDKWNKKFGNL